MTWIKAFEEAYNDTKTSMWRSAKIEGNEIHISYHHSQLALDHIPALQKAVGAANDLSKKIEESFEEQRAKNIAKEEEQKNLKEGILNNINSSIRGVILTSAGTATVFIVAATPSLKAARAVGG